MLLKCNFIKNNKGSSAIILALTMTTILGFCAIVSDVGLVVLERQKMQNAVDATALAAAHELPVTAKAENIARNYIRLNGYSPEDITISYENSNKEIVIACTKTFGYKLARILGLDSTTISVSATALLDTIGGPFNYALFTGSTTDPLELNGGGFYIDGSAHSNQRFVMTGASQTITGACEAVSTIRITGTGDNIGQRVPNAPVIEMPDFSDSLITEAQNAGQVYIGDKTFNSENINLNAPIYVDGNVTINTSKFTGNGVIIATGNIIFNGSNLRSSGNDGVAFYSINGNITINGSNAVVDGVMYTPRGILRFNGSNQVINGRVVSYQAPFNGGSSRIISGTYDLKGLPSYDIRLVK